MKKRFTHHIRAVLALLLTVLSVLSTARPVSAEGTIIYVDDSATSGSDNGTSWTDAYIDLQTALSAAVGGDQIWVAAGTYKPTSGIDRAIGFALKNGVAVYGGFAGTETLLGERDPASNRTILSGDLNGDDSGFTNNSENSYHVVTGNGTNNTAILDGFTITRGNANGSYPNDRGGGFFIDEGNPTLANLTLSANVAEGGGGMYNASSSPTLINLTLSGNSAADGGGMMNEGNSSPTLTNLTLSGNSATDGGGMYNSGLSNPTLTNVTISGNSASNAGGGMFNDFSYPAIYNTILWGNGSEMGSALGSAPTITDSIVQGGCPAGASCTNVINSNPLLGVLQANGGFTKTMALGSGSSAIDAGGVNSTCTSEDQRGMPRPQGANCDIGAFEYDLGPVLYVQPAGLTTGFCDSWSAACELSYALANATSGDQIWAAAGTYKPTSGTDRNISFALKSGVEVYGGFDGSEAALGERDHASNLTILSGDLNGDDSGFTNNSENSYHVVTGGGTDNTAVLDGFTITGGYANGSSPNNRGGGLYLEDGDPTLTNLTISGNAAHFGGGMLNSSSSPTLTNVTISGNAASIGGGMSNSSSSSPTLTNVTISGNTAGNMGGGMSNVGGSPTLTNVTLSGNSALVSGGGLRNSNSSPTLTNLTLSGNSATFGGGMMNELGSSPTLTNVTLSGNSASDAGGGIYNQDSSPALNDTILWGNGSEITNSGSSSSTVTDSIVQGGCPSGASCTDVLNSDPLLGALQNNGGFTQTMALGSGSPAIDAGGVNSTCAFEDQRGMPRPQGANCDIGAFENSLLDSSILYVKPTAPGSGFCASWDHACSLIYALSNAAPGQQIWVAAGTYKPTSSTDRTISFVLVNGVEVYGGFDGSETLLSQRDPASNLTILSGDLNGDDSGFTSNGENSYHVVVGHGTDNTAVLDGFTITGGNANDSFPNHMGGGLYLEDGDPTLTNLTLSGNSATFGGGMINQPDSSPTLTNVTFSNNAATESGGGIFNQQSSPTLINVTIRGNSASSGGGIYNSNSVLTLSNVTIRGNSASNSGGGMSNSSSSPTLTNVTISGNSASTGGGMMNEGNSNPTLTSLTISGNSATFGGGMFNDDSNPAISNTILWGNGSEMGNTFSSAPAITDSIVQGGCPSGANCTNVLNSDPVLGALKDNGGFTNTRALGTGSSAIDKGGINSTCAATDQRGVNRPQGSGCDIGAYEAQIITASFKSAGAQDGWVLETSETSNKGSTTNPTATTFLLGDTANKQQYRSILSFNTASLPNNAVITKVMLKIRKQSITGTNPFTTHLKIAIDILQGAFSNLGALQATDFQAAASKPSVGSVANNPQPGGWYLSNLKAVAYPFVNRTGLTQLRLRFQLDDDNDAVADFMRFYSGNAAAANQPALVIEYYVP